MNNVSKQTIGNEKIINDVRMVQVSDNSLIVSEAKTLLREYGDYMYKELELIAGKENFIKDLEQFPSKDYLPPSGLFVIAKLGNTIAGCVGIKKFDKHSCETKRLFIRSLFRGKGLGKLLCNYVIEWCNKNGYKRILLDTNLEMKEAVALYYKYGFKEIEPYCINNNKHPVFMEYVL